MLGKDDVLGKRHAGSASRHFCGDSGKLIEQ